MQEVLLVVAGILILAILVGFVALLFWVSWWVMYVCFCVLILYIFQDNTPPTTHLFAKRFAWGVCIFVWGGFTLLVILSYVWY